jgi:hypothetical protein
VARIARDVQSHAEPNGAGWYQAVPASDSRTSTLGCTRKSSKAQELLHGTLQVRFPPL